MTIEQFGQSEIFLKRALATIPLASQTFSKSLLSFPEGVSPYFAEKGKGCYLYDVDGNQYTDFISALLSISLGYADEDVNGAVTQQLELGSIFSLPHRLEFEVAELLTDLIPCADMVRFGKNGSDATSAAVRLARAYTQKDMIAVCGYHGWQDWYIGSTSRDLGVPKSTKALTHAFTYNDIDSLKALFKTHANEFAAVIMEPMNLYYPKDDFLAKVKDLCVEHDVVLIFDETITGFRFDINGAQQLFGVTPDLATFGKGMANGFPISAVVGRKDIMTLMEDIFFSGTFGGDTIALAAAKATILKMQDHKVLPHVHAMGNSILKQLNNLIEAEGLADYFSTAGHPSWSFLVSKDGRNHDVWTIKTYLMQQLISQGFISNGSHNLSFSHKQQHIDQLMAAYSEILPQIKYWDNKGQLSEQLRCPPLQPIFKVR
jgi:glutamate-1-semialdehyde 2,1-aminomutase